MVDLRLTPASGRSSRGAGAGGTASGAGGRAGGRGRPGAWWLVNTQRLIG
jgi:hypothetical protein